MVLGPRSLVLCPWSSVLGPRSLGSQGESCQAVGVVGAYIRIPIPRVYKPAQIETVDATVKQQIRESVYLAEESVLLAEESILLPTEPHLIPEELILLP